MNQSTRKISLTWSIGGNYSNKEFTLINFLFSLEQAKLGKTKPATLEGQSVYITGGASGIGLACAHTFGKSGANLYIVDMNTETLEKAVKELKAAKYPVHYKQVNVTKYIYYFYHNINCYSFKQVKKSFTDMTLAYGGCDILINNAGKSFIVNGMANCTEEMLKESFEINVYGQQYANIKIDTSLRTILGTVQLPLLRL